MSILSRPYFHDEAAAFAKLESLVWPNGPTCPKCGAVDRINRLADQKTKPSKKHPEGKPVIGLWKCYHCRGQFTVRVGTVFEASHVPLYKWLQAVHLMASSKKGISANQLARTLEVQVNTGWFMAHRIREAMRDGSLAPMGGAGGIVEIDETYIGQKKEKPVGRIRGDGKVLSGRSYHNKNTVLTLVERGGKARSFHVKSANIAEVAPIVLGNIAKESRIETDEAMVYRKIGRQFEGGHFAVNHGKEEYVRGDHFTNTIEGFFSIFKRGMKGVYQHCGEQHLHRYLAEFDFRYNNRIALGVDDVTRADEALKGIVGKRLTYRMPN